MKYRLLITVIFFAIVVPQGTATYAAQGDDPTLPPEGSEEAATDGEDTAEAPASVDVFIPTEDISEDFAVSFPVDI